MKKTLVTISCALATLAAGPGLASEHSQSRPGTGAPAPRMLPRPHLEGLEPPRVEVGAPITAYEMRWGGDGPETTRKRLVGALGTLIGREVAYELLEASVLERALQKEEAGSWTPIENTGILVRFDPQYNEIRLVNEELDLFQDDSRDIGEEAAAEAAEAYLERLGEAGAVEPRLYERAALQIGYAMVGDGAIDEEVRPGRVVEYRFTFRPRLNGFEMANAGLRMGILSSGELANLRFGGATPLGEWKEGELVSTLAGAEKEIRVGTQEVMQRFYRELPDHARPAIAWSRVMYAIPDGKSRAVVEPMFVVSYALQTEVEGQRVASRRKTLAFSLTDPEAAPIDFDAPAAKHESPETTRQAPGRTGKEG